MVPQATPVGAGAAYDISLALSLQTLAVERRRVIKDDKATDVHLLNSRIQSTLSFNSYCVGEGVCPKL